MPTSGKNTKPFPALPGIVILALSILGLSTSSIALAQTNTTSPTTIVISENPKLTNAKRLGINLGTQNYWDSGMIMRNLAFGNPGFEGETWQTILHCKYVTATSCTDDNIYTYWPVNFLAGATASFIVGPAAGTSATVTSSTLPVPGTSATTIQMSGLSVAPSVGDYVVVRKEVPGTAEAGWWPQGNATYSTETNDLSPNTPGKQALLVNASGPGQQAVLANFDDGAHISFIRLNGNYTISFRAKSIGGSTDLHINLKRLVNAPPALNFLDRDVTLTSQWQDYSFTYPISETTTTLGPIVLTFTLTGGSMLFDDAAFTEAAGPNNPTAYRDAVVTALQTLHPGTIRYMDTGENWGSSIDNLLAVDFARERAGYSNLNSQQNAIPMGLHDFLVLCKTVGADPWFTMPTGMTTQEMSNLMDYFGGSTSTVYGAKRAALGQTAPWTTVFGQIHLEFGNEVWNTGNPGALMNDAASYGKRAAVIFTTAKASPSYSAKSFDFILDGFEALPGWTQTALQNSKNYDTVDVATYNFSSFNDASSTENIFGPMLAQPEYMNDASLGLTNLQAQAAATAGPTPANLAVYETNLGTNGGSATQAQVADAVPSLGAGLAVAANMLLAQRDLGVTVQNLFALEGYFVPFYGTGSAPATTSPLWGATIDIGGPTNLRRPMFLSEQLANSAILPTLLSTSQTGANPTWNQAYTTNDNFSLPSAHFIQSFAYTDGTTLNVILFNLSRTSALPVNFAGLNAPVGTATVSTLTAAAIDANNETTENVAIKKSSQSLTGGSTMTLPPFSMTVVSVPAPVIPVLITGVTASCARSSLSPNGSTTCSAAVAGQGVNYNTSVVWSAALGSISSSGAYTAPAALPANGKDVITATAVGDSTKTGSFTIALAPNTVTGITASCPATNVNQGATIQCTANVTGTGGFSNAVTWSATDGSFTSAANSSTGSFTAPSTGTSVTLTATSTQDPTKSANVTLALNAVLVMSTPTVTATGTTATVSWTTNIYAYGGINYSSPNSPGGATPFVQNAGTKQSITITGLLPNTTYFLYAFSFAGPQNVGQNLTVTTTSGTAGVSAVSVSCSAASLQLGSSTGCASTVQGDGSYSSAVSWSTSLGTISATGVVTAPSSSTATALTVTATSVQDPTKSGSATIALTAPATVTGVTVACQATTILAGSTTTCSPTVTGTGIISKAVTFAASAGNITPAGVLTAPTTGTSVLVTATSVQDATKSASATITVTPLPTITGVSVVCQTTSLAVGGTTSCAPTVTGTGSYTSAVTWSVSAGSITPGGNFTAPSSGTSAVVTATSTQDPTKSGSATLTLTQALTLSGLTSSVTSTTATLSWTTNLPAYGGVNYSLPNSPGSATPFVQNVGTKQSITITGLLPSTTYVMYAFSFAGPQTVGQQIMVTTASAASTITGVSVSCSGASVVAGNTVVCTSNVTGTGSYSSAVIWSATAGSITSNGVLTAPTTGTAVTVRANSVQDPTKSATATITVTPLATIGGVTVSCPASTLVAGSSTTCAASVTGTGSYSSAVTWSATGGSITSGGVLTTSTTATSVTVKATSVQDPTKSGTATIALTQPVAVNSVKVYCPVSTLEYTRSVTCSASVAGTGSPSSAVTWSASTGTITTAGVVTAPATGSSITVTATSTQDPTKSGSVTMALVENLAISNPTFVASTTTIVVSWNLTDYAYSSVSYNSGTGTPTVNTPPATIAMTHPSFTLTGLTPGTTYNLTLTSVNKFAAVSHKLTVTTPLQ
jgi:alpha-L-arabinofuranosidase